MKNFFKPKNFKLLKGIGEDIAKSYGEDRIKEKFNLGYNSKPSIGGLIAGASHEMMKMKSKGYSDVTGGINKLKFKQYY